MGGAFVPNSFGVRGNAICRLLWSRSDCSLDHISTYLGRDDRWMPWNVCGSGNSCWIRVIYTEGFVNILVAVLLALLFGPFTAYSLAKRVSEKLYAGVDKVRRSPPESRKRQRRTKYTVANASDSGAIAQALHYCQAPRSKHPAHLGGSAVLSDILPRRAVCGLAGRASCLR